MLRAAEASPLFTPGILRRVSEPALRVAEGMTLTKTNLTDYFDNVTFA
jgi:hypothetical protein